MPDNPSGQLGTSNGIAALRWEVRLFRRDQVPGPSSRVDEIFVLIAVVHADIQATYPGTFYTSAQVDTPVTHLIRTRWLDYLENVHIIKRVTKRPTDGTYRTEQFRVRRVKEIGGRKRFTEFECEFEYVRTTETDSDAEYVRLFAEGGGANSATVLH